MSEFGGKFKLPNPEILISTKLKSVTDRTKDDKRIKDVSDIYALLWHSKTDFTQLKQEVQKILGLEKIKSVVQALTDKDYDAASTANRVPEEEISRVINEVSK